jgi:hypothetical protein
VGLTSLLRAIELDHQTALEAQRIGALPENELEKVLARAPKSRGIGMV